MNTIQICQTRQELYCDQQIFLTAALILVFKGILRHHLRGPCRWFVSCRRSLPSPALGDLPCPSQRKRRLFRLLIVSFTIGRWLLRSHPYLRLSAPSIVPARHPERGGVSNPGKPCFLVGRGGIFCARPLPCPRPQLEQQRQGQGRQTRDKEEHGGRRIKLPLCTRAQARPTVDPLSWALRRRAQ